MGFYFSPENVRLRKLVRPQESDVRGRTPLINCTTCKHLVDCNHAKKSFEFKCNKYEQPKSLKKHEYMDMLDFNKVQEDREKERETFFDIQQMIDQAISDQEQGIQTDFTLEDGDIPLAKNFLDFYISPKYGYELVPFPKQIEITAELLTEACLNPKCTDVAYLADIPKDASIDSIQEKITFLEHGKCPACHQTRFDMWDKYKARRANTMTLISGQRSGKDYEIGLASAYQDHRFLKLRKPAQALHLAQGNVLFQTFTGIDYGQAKKATFLPYKDIITKSKWYNQYHEMLDHVAHKKGKKLYFIGEDSITWSYHGLATLVSSPDVRALRGIARRSWSITEYAYFYTKTKAAVRLDAEGIFEALQNSTAGVISGYDRCLEEGKYDTPQPLTFIASSPRSIRDPAMVMLKVAEEDTSMVARHYSSFEFNPNLKESSLAAFKIRNPDKYRTSILAMPADSASAFIPDKRLFMACIDPDRANAVSGKNREVITPSKARMTSGVIKIKSNADTTSPKVMSIDTSLNNNSFALVVAHLEEWKKEGLVTVFDALYEVIPSKTKPCFYPDIYDNVIRPICEELNVVMVVTDRYPGSTQLMQTIDLDLGLPGLIRSVKYADHNFFRQCLYSASMSFPKMECTPDDAKKFSVTGYPHSFERKPVAHTLMQAITVEDLMGKKVDKGEGFTDDLFYAAVNAHAVCNDPNFQEEFLGDGTEETTTEELVGVKVGYSTGVQSITSVGGSGTSEADMVIGVSSSFKGI